MIGERGVVSDTPNSSDEIEQEAWTPDSDGPSPLAQAVARWAEGTRYTHEHFWADPSKFVGHVPAGEHRAAEARILADLPTLVEFAEWAMFYLDAEGGCRYDHHGYCQSHGLDVRPCPVERAYDVLRRAPLSGRSEGSDV